jgi:hypothetical protein
MDDRLAAVAAIVVGVAVAAVGTAEYLLPGLAPPPMDPFATGAFVVGTGVSLCVAGTVAFLNRLDHLALRLATAAGVGTLALAVLSPESLLFGGIFWLAMVSAGVVGVGSYRTVVKSR